jgi:hypothetical protein
VWVIVSTCNETGRRYVLRRRPDGNGFLWRQENEDADPCTAFVFGSKTAADVVMAGIRDDLDWGGRIYPLCRVVRVRVS